MENKIINGKLLAKSLKESISEKIKKINKNPTLAVILIGDNSASKIYVKNKEIACNKCGIKSLKYEFSENITQDEILKLINDLNNNKDVNGILVQLPLPKHIDEKLIINSISPEKDVDCFSPINVGKLFIGDYDFDKSILPCTPKGCIKLIKSALGNNLNGKKACIVGRSNIVGKPIAQMLLKENCTVKIIHSKTKNIKEETLWADILVVAIGKPKFITEDMVKEHSTIVDVGINRIENTLCGDIDFDNVIKKVDYITPVPGGVGPMTIACLMENTLNAFINQNNIIQ